MQCQGNNKNGFHSKHIRQILGKIAVLMKGVVDLPNLSFYDQIYIIEMGEGEILISILPFF